MEYFIVGIIVRTNLQGSHSLLVVQPVSEPRVPSPLFFRWPTPILEFMDRAPERALSSADANPDNGLAQFNSRLLGVLTHLRSKSPGVRKSNKGGWQSTADLFELSAQINGLSLLISSALLLGC